MVEFWNAGGLLSFKFPELKTVKYAYNVDVFPIVENRAITILVSAIIYACLYRD